VLRQLHITGLGVIRELDMEPAAGLTVLTGETGAGKTMITVGISLALGSRGGAQLVRDGDGSAKVQARFDAAAGAEEWAEDGEVILARTIGAEGRGSARIGGQLTTATALAEMGSKLVEIHGQHQSLRLLDGATQTAFLDRFAGTEQVERVAAYRAAYATLQTARRELDGLMGAARERERALDLLAYQVREIESVGPRAGETDELQAEATRLGHAERLQELADAAVQALAQDGGAGDLLATAARRLDSAASIDVGASDLAERGNALAAEVTDLIHEVRAYREGVAIDPGRLQHARERLSSLQALQRKYGATDADVVAFLEQARDELDSLQTADDRLEELRGELDAASTAVAALAEAAHASRAEASPGLGRALTQHLEDLGMPGAVLELGVERAEDVGPLGIDRVELRFRGGPSQPLLPLAKAASGGELSRVMLACRSVLADLDDVPTLVFDEVDAGIGGQAGLAVGRRLAQLATARQVLVVTHLPQIACFADLHVRVRKEDGEAIAEVLDDRERPMELSRMLAGMEASEHALSHAEELLDEAARVRAGAS